MSILRKLFGNTNPYKFLSWLYGNYQEEQARILRPGQFKEYGRNVKIEPDVLINMPQRVVLKDNVAILRGTIINSMGGLYIGRYSGIGYNCTIFTVQHHYRNACTIPFDQGVDLKPVIIREFVWTGAGVMIMPGIEIGEGAIIGMGAVVTKNIPPLAIVLGNPAEVIGYRSKEHFQKCKEDGRFQHVMVGQYSENLPYMYKVRFETELKEIGLM
jgi:maltose O-acetyltransferase